MTDVIGQRGIRHDWERFSVCRIEEVCHQAGENNLSVGVEVCWTAQQLRNFSEFSLPLTSVITRCQVQPMRRIRPNLLHILDGCLVEVKQHCLLCFGHTDGLCSTPY